jgi:SP family arabinose:H+ symporter-like MFS transporter
MKNVVNYRYVLFLAITAALGGLLFGFDIAIITGAGQFLAEHFHLNDINLGLAFSSLLFGCALGSAATGYVADRFGRKTPLLWVSVLFALTSAATGLAPTFNLLLLARFVGGLAVGGISILAPMYIAEIAPPKLRGRLCACYQLAIVIGILASFLINYLLRDIGPWNWRWMFLTGILPSVLFFILLLGTPETPRYLFKIGKEKECRDILARIAGEAEADDELEEIRASLATHGKGWRELTKGGMPRAMFVGFCLAVLIHFSGINTIIDYAPVIFKSAGFKLDAALFSTFGIGICNLSFTLVSFGIIDRFGRKPLYLIGSVGMAIVLVLLAVAVRTDHFSGTTVLVLILSYIAFFAACIGPVFWTLVPEIFPNRVRGEAMIVPVLTQWVANAVVVLFFPSVFHQIGKDYTFLLLAAMALLQAVFTWFFVPETKNKSLEEIEHLWNRTGPVTKRRSPVIAVKNRI